MVKNQKKKMVFLAVVLLFLIVLVIGVVKKFTPSKEVKKLTDYYEVGEGEVLLFMEDGQYYENGRYVKDHIYLSYDTVVKEINKRFYWDKYEKQLVYTTPTEIIKIEPGKNSYLVGKNTKKTDYVIVEASEDEVYIALDFIKEYSNIEYEIFRNPDRVVINCHWGEEFEYAEVKKSLSVRTSPSIKSPIVAELQRGELVTFANVEAEPVPEDFVKVMTSDGVVGYAKRKYFMDSYKEELKNNYKEPEYKNIKMPETINMVWHQVTTSSGTDAVEALLKRTKGVNVISPTWFSIKNADGEITSLANPAYVEKAHKNGAKVWALVDDFNTEINKELLFGRTSSRERLSNELIASAIKNNIDGINIDFEKITPDTAKGYLQFIRELSVKCRNNGIVLSIDNYVPAPYNTFYDRKEQGIVADYVICMAYDEHYAGSEESGSVSSIGYVKEAVANMTSEVPAEKVIMALPFYTRLWKEEAGKITSQAYSMTNAVKLMQDKGITLEWKDDVGQYYGEYKEGNAIYRMWLEDEKSYELKLKESFSQEIAGVSAWKLSLENRDIWDVIVKYTKK